jgi:drug/metabolite transporter (DMT)-like permease
LEAAVLYFLYVAVKSDEVSRVFPLTGLGPIMTLVIGWLESLEPLQLAAMCLFLVGGVILALEPGKGSRIVISKALRPIVIGSLLTSLFTLTLRFAFVASDFWSGFFYSRLGFFVAGLVILYLFRGEITKQWMSLPRRWHVGLIANQTLAFSGHLFYFFSLSLASAALVQATLSAQSGIIFIMALAVSWWSPKLLEERVTRAALLQKFIGIGLVTVAAFLLAVM